MAKELKRQGTDYYYDSHPTEEDLMGETIEHAELVHYLREVLRWLFRGRHYGVYDNLNFYQTGGALEYPLAPDLAVIKGVNVRSGKSWRVGETGPVPQVVIEIASEGTWRKDLEDKPKDYGHMGVREYFAYDPNEPMLSRSRSRRLWGWQLDPGLEQMQLMAPGPGGQLWSRHLESYLVPDGEYLRLSDNQGHRRLTGEEAEAEARQAAERRAEAEAKRAEALAEKLRSLGIDPNQL